MNNPILRVTMSCSQDQLFDGTDERYRYNLIQKMIHNRCFTLLNTQYPTPCGIQSIDMSTPVKIGILQKVSLVIVNKIGEELINAILEGSTFSIGYLWLLAGGDWTPVEISKIISWKRTDTVVPFETEREFIFSYWDGWAIDWTNPELSRMREVLTDNIPYQSE